MRSFAKFLVALIIIFLGGLNFARAYTLKSFEGRFSIEFPSQPKAEHIRGIGTCLRDRYEFRVSQGEKVWYASYQDCLPHGYLADTGNGPFLLEMGIGLAGSLRGELRASDPIEHGVLSGREYLVLVHGDKHIVRAQVFIDGDRVYKIMYVGPVFTQEDSEVEAFFASFRVMR